MLSIITKLSGQHYPQAASKIAGSLFILWLLTACATAPQTRQLLVDNALPAAIQLDDVPFFPQQEYQCGPAALAMLLNHAGSTVTATELVRQVYLPARKGSLQIEILASTRRYQHIPYVIAPRLEHLLREIEAGNPVLVLQNLGLNWAPVWHYAVAIGYNLPQRQIILHSGTEAARVVSLKAFERTWQRAKHWGLVITTIDQVPASAEPHRFLTAIATLRDPGSSHRAYVAAARRWPRQLLPQISLGNSYYNQGDPAAAEQAYRTASKYHPQSAMALNNLAQTLADQNKLDEALAIARRAVKVGGAFSREAQDTLNEIEQLLALKPGK